MARSTARYGGGTRLHGTQRPSQTQQPSQTQRTARDMQEDEEEEGDGEHDGEHTGTDTEQALSRKANALVRLALFNESRRLPLRRDEINKRVLVDSTRMFKPVFALAQSRLQSAFGMELVELKSRAERELEQSASTGAPSLATGVKKKAAPGSKTYILRSTLHPALLEAAAVTDADLLDCEHEEIPDDDDGNGNPNAYGSIISWSTADQLGALGILYVVLALILVHGNMLPDSDLKKHFKSFSMAMESPMDFTSHSPNRAFTLKSYLDHLCKQGYLDVVEVNLAGTAPRATQGKRGRPSNVEEEDGISYEWTWGSRAQAEIGEAAIGLFIAEFMVERTLKDNGDEEAAGEGQGRGRKKKSRNDEEDRDKMLQTVLNGITRAAGGQLRDIS